MKQYVNAIERRLNLPRELKARVMSDFISSISARRESGQTDEQIYAELGTPDKVAAELNEQMAEFTYQKSPWRFACLALAIVSGATLLWKLILHILILLITRQSEAASVGVIGGADGPTAIFVTSTVSPQSKVILTLVLLVAAFVIGCIGFRKLSRCKRQ